MRGSIATTLYTPQELIIFKLKFDHLIKYHLSKKIIKIEPLGKNKASIIDQCRPILL